MAGVTVWGVWVEGSSVEVVADGLSAFRREALWREVGCPDALAVWSSDGRLWWPIDRRSMYRPDPAPPAQARGWREAFARRGRNRVQFRRRATKTGFGYTP